jgi:hypothetical protein
MSFAGAIAQLRGGYQRRTRCARFYAPNCSRHPLATQYAADHLSADATT